MSENIWKKAAGYSVVIAVTASSYLVVQTEIDSRRAALPVIEYFECPNKFQSYDWDTFPGEKPPGEKIAEILEKAHIISSKKDPGKQRLGADLLANVDIMKPGLNWII